MLWLVLSSLTRDANGRSKRLVLQLGSRIAHAIRVDHLKPGAGIGRGAGDGVPRCGWPWPEDGAASPARPETSALYRSVSLGSCLGDRRQDKTMKAQGRERET